MKIIETRWVVATTILVAALLTPGCGGEDEPTEFPADPDIVAVFDGGVVTLAEVDAAMRTRAAGETLSSDLSARDRIEIVIEDLVLERLLLVEPLDPGELERRLAPLRREELRRATVAEFLEERLPETERPTEAEIREYFETHEELRHREGRRQVHNIFLGKDGRNGDVDLAAAAAEIRGRFVRGESFANLAQEFSDSESRHQGGLVGWLGRKHLAPPLAEAVFALEENRISEPIETPQGIHLFLVTDVIEPGSLTFEDVRARIVEGLKAERRETAIEALVDALPEISGVFVAAEEDLEFLLDRGEPTAEVLRVGDYRLDVAGLRALLISRRTQGLQSNARNLLKGLVNRERIFTAASAEGMDRNPKVEEVLDRALRAAELQIRRRLVVERLVDDDPEALEAWFGERRNRYLGPLRLRLSRLIIPFEPSIAGRTMAALEALSRSAGVDLERLRQEADRLGGRVEDEQWMTLAELSAIRPVAAAVASRLDAGGVSPPFRTEATLELVLVHERQLPVEQPFAAVRARVRDDFLEARGRELYGQWVRSALEDCGLHIEFSRVGTIEGEDEPGEVG